MGRCLGSRDSHHESHTDQSHLQYRLTEDERQQFEKNGYFIVPSALDSRTVSTLNDASDRVEQKLRPSYEQRGLKPHQPLNVLDFIGKDTDFLPLIDWPKTFMKVVDILGWHIQLYHSHIIITPPLPVDFKRRSVRLGWHQDSGRINFDIESNPRPRISLNVGFFITDTTETDRGNFHVVPGSHLHNKLKLPDNETLDHPYATPITTSPGDAVFFDRRLWHAAGRNTSSMRRKALFYGYSYRWLKLRDDMTVSHYMKDADPIHKQLLGASPNGGFGFTSPTDEDVPLKSWLERHLGRNSVIP